MSGPIGDGRGRAADRQPRPRATPCRTTTRRYVDMFWELIDEILNAVLFVLLGMEVLRLAFTGTCCLAAA